MGEALFDQSCRVTPSQRLGGPPHRASDFSITELYTCCAPLYTATASWVGEVGTVSGNATPLQQLTDPPRRNRSFEGRHVVLFPNKTRAAPGEVGFLFAEHKIGHEPNYVAAVEGLCLASFLPQRDTEEMLAAKGGWLPNTGRWSCFSLCLVASETIQVLPGSIHSSLSIGILFETINPNRARNSL
jgi:hypothetical protein